MRLSDFRNAVNVADLRKLSKIGAKGKVDFMRDDIVHIPFGALAATRFNFASAKLHRVVAVTPAGDVNVIATTSSLTELNIVFNSFRNLRKGFPRDDAPRYWALCYEVEPPKMWGSVHKMPLIRKGHWDYVGHHKVFDVFGYTDEVGVAFCYDQ